MIFLGKEKCMSTKKKISPHRLFGGSSEKVVESSMLREKFASLFKGFKVQKTSLISADKNVSIPPIITNGAIHSSRRVNGSLGDTVREASSSEIKEASDENTELKLRLLRLS